MSDQVQGAGYPESEVEMGVTALELEMDAAANELKMDTVESTSGQVVCQEISKHEQYSAD
jgi:hypothetical protein